MCMLVCFFFFFFQAEDGIRDLIVTGVQTCALPIFDRLAARYDFSASGLAKKAGLDPTSFNRSKRITPEGRPRWPSTESIAKVLQATGASIDEFVTLLSQKKGRRPTKSVPVIALAQAGSGGYFDNRG